MFFVSLMTLRGDTVCVERDARPGQVRGDLVWKIVQNTTVEGEPDTCWVYPTEGAAVRVVGSASDVAHKIQVAGAFESRAARILGAAPVAPVVADVEHNARVLHDVLVTVFHMEMDERAELSAHLRLMGIDNDSVLDIAGQAALRGRTATRGQAAPAKDPEPVRPRTEHAEALLAALDAVRDEMSEEERYAFVSSLQEEGVDADVLIMLSERRAAAVRKAGHKGSGGH